MLLANALRKTVFTRALLVLALSFYALSAQGAGNVPPRLVTLFTGDRSGVYYYAGGTICALVNARRWTSGVRCLTQASGGSIENLQALRRGDAGFAIVQSDWQFHAVNGTDVFEGRGPDRSLRSVMSLYPEPFSILARGTSGIARLSDIVGKRVSIGPLGSGGRATMEMVMAEMGWGAADFAHIADLRATELAKALCDGDIDAAVLVIAHPNLAVEDILSSCDIILVPVDREISDRLVAEHPFFFRYAIPGGTYPGQTSSVDTFALAATLVTTSRTPPAAVRTVAEALVDGLAEFRARHPSFAEFDTGQMLHDGLTAPLHGAARRFYEEAGLRP
ncbi:TRAP transporter solute receptor, TAXI family precursor [Rhodovulum sp. P5]|uniref:TAXI family TRAP transporter solute-binding subunit n=1 Tax=Rhodovulum sp. P5 TaxID=1564506 RepID=UPI0009C1E6C6|nr:TAXI family TRAP transporter solute-binding subunit [Rhodovulum sp. P5]ARE39262.1 TRAP transporter solute receptor, TAXI family precursor [Rhodovulum sp. P5]